MSPNTIFLSMFLIVSFYFFMVMYSHSISEIANVIGCGTISYVSGIDSRAIKNIANSYY
jgi:hypothetical protein